MKKIQFVAAFIVFAFMSMSINLTEVQAAKTLYDFKNAEIVLESTGPMNKTVQKVSVGEGGKYVRQESTSEINVFGMQRTETQISYTDYTNNMVYNYDPKTQSATATDISEMMDGVEKGEMYAFDKASIAKRGGTILRKEKYKGLACTVVEFKDFFSTVWFHKKYPVRTISNAGGMEITTELVSFKEGAAKDYKLPKGTKIGKTQNMGDIMQKLHAYKDDPEFQESQRGGNSLEGFMTDENIQNDPVQRNRVNTTPNMADIQKAIAESGTEMQEAMKAFAGMFGNSEE